MQLKWLEDLLTLAEEGSLARAAQRRHVTHPAFGRRIRALEAWAGAPLIDRDAPSLRFTAHGEVVLEAARETIGALATARRARTGEGDDGCPLHIASGRTLARTLLPTWYARMQPLIGQRKFKVSTRELQQVAPMLESGEADFMLTYFHPILALRLDARRSSYLQLADEALIPVWGCEPDARPLRALSRRKAASWLSYSGSLALGRLVEDHLLNISSHHFCEWRSNSTPPTLRTSSRCVDSVSPGCRARWWRRTAAWVAWFRSAIAATKSSCKCVSIAGDNACPRWAKRYGRPRRKTTEAEAAVPCQTSTPACEIGTPCFSLGTIM